MTQQYFGIIVPAALALGVFCFVWAVGRGGR